MLAWCVDRLGAGIRRNQRGRQSQDNLTYTDTQREGERNQKGNVYLWFAKLRTDVACGYFSIAYSEVIAF